MWNYHWMKILKNVTHLLPTCPAKFCYQVCNPQFAVRVAVAGMDLTLFMTAHMELCFGFVTKIHVCSHTIVLTIDEQFLHRVKAFSVSHFVPHQWVDQEQDRSWEETTRRADLKQLMRYSKPCDALLSNKSVEFCLARKPSLGTWVYLPFHNLFYFSSLLYLLKFHNLDPQSFSLLLFLFSPHPTWKGSE